MNTSNLLNELAAMLGEDNVLTAARAEAGVWPVSWRSAPTAILTPGTVEDVVSVVRAAEAAGIAILPCGGGTQLATGYPPHSDTPYLLLKTTRLNRILDHQPDDLTVTCEPGVTLARLQSVLGERRQQLALDVPLPDHATLGGIVAANASGFWRPAYGTPRDLLIGLHAVMTGGELVKGGGKVVKNVAGYDVCKLFTGSWGTVGVLTELTFKVRPLPEASSALAWEAPDLSTAARVGLSLHHTRLSATFLLATNERQGRPELLLGLQGTEGRVAWQREEFARLAAEAGLTAPPVAVSESELSSLRDRQARNTPETVLAARIACLPTELPNLLSRLEALPPLALTAHCASGTLSLAACEADAALITLIDALKPGQANRVWTRIPWELAEGGNVAIWGEAREDFVLQRALKQALDPKKTFSPGRFLGRL